MNIQDRVTKAKCPKCGCKDLMLTEVWRDHTIQWEQVDGKIDRNDGVLEPGFAHKVEGKCSSCKHKWTFRNVIQIDNLLNPE